MSQGEKHLVIKKYANRKFYDTESSRYVTLSEIQNHALNRSVIVIDNKTKRDITRKTLAMSLVESLGESETVSVSDIVDLIKKSKV
ncbi:MAG: hypothetical protein HC840_00520 [Leptolyngbyaceae cyanobacterium RM2_2_4]|nr:hypothetical protein [Leptolyngbyaceae cyanobacterium RM2_2_4]